MNFLDKEKPIGYIEQYKTNLLYSGGWGGILAIETLLFRCDEIPDGGLSIEVPGDGVFPGWREDLRRLETHSVIPGRGWQDNLLGFLEGPYISFPKGFEGALEVYNVNDNVLVKGRLVFVVRLSCSRCIEDFEKEIAISFKNILTYKAIEEKELELDRDDLEFTLLDGDVVDCSHLIIEQISTNIPVKPLCREDCKGLCQKCGKNLNIDNCSCNNEVIDVRFEKLKGLKID